MFEIFENTTPLVEGISIDEAFLDVGGLRRVRPVRRSRSRARLRAEVLDRVGLAITVGIARTKLLAKVASASRNPTVCSSCRPSDERGFLDPLPIERLWGVGR